MNWRDLKVTYSSTTQVPKLNFIQDDDEAYISPMESFKSKQSGDSGICLKASQSDDDAAAATTLLSQPDGLVMKSTTLTDEFDETVNVRFTIYFNRFFSYRQIQHHHSRTNSKTPQA